MVAVSGTNHLSAATQPGVLFIVKLEARVCKEDLYLLARAPAVQAEGPRFHASYQRASSSRLGNRSSHRVLESQLPIKTCETGLIGPSV